MIKNIDMLIFEYHDYSNIYNKIAYSNCCGRPIECHI